MEKHSNVAIIICCIVLMFIAFQAVPVQAKDYYAVLQFTNPKIGLSQLVFQKCDSKMLCRKLNENHWKGVRTSCPNCVRDFEFCGTTISNSYKGIYRNKPIMFPYLSSKNDRIIYFGVAMEDAIKICKWAVDAYKTKLNRPAIAILPLDLYQ